MATEEDPPAAAVVKGSPRMVPVIERAVRDHQRDPGRDVRVPLTETDLTLRLTRAVYLRARARARALELPHNVARKRFVTDLLNALVHDQAARLDRPVDEEELRYAPAELWRQPTVRAALDALWPPLSPQGLVDRLLTHPPTLESAAAPLTPAERAALTRPAGGPWTLGDVPLLDEAAELLGVREAKGLEFDHVVLTDPAGILAQSAHGGHDLYVALTRVTRRLTVVHEGELPAVLRCLDRAADRREGAADEGVEAGPVRVDREDPDGGGGALSEEWRPQDILMSSKVADVERSIR